MHTRLVAALAAALALAAPGCKKTPAQPRAVGATAGPNAPAGPRLPAPHDLSKEPDAGAYVAEPAAVLAGLDAYVPQAPQLPAVAEVVLGTQAPAELADRLAKAIAGDRAWAGVHVAGEDVIALPVQAGAEDDVAAALKPFPARGDFGAVELPPPALQLERGGKPAAPRLAWFDAQTGTLVLARTPAGLATSRELAQTYGERPLWATVTGERAAAYAAGFPYARLLVSGQSLHRLDAAAIARAGETLPPGKNIAPGALTGMLRDPAIAVGGSTRWPGYRDAVREAIREMQANVDRAGFAAKMMLDPLVDQAARLLKRWNGRVLVGVGPARYLRLGLGADQPTAALRDATVLVRTLLENLSLARMFADVPGASMRKVEGGAADIFVLTVDGISRQVPPFARPLLDDKGRLRVAFAASDHAGGLLVVVGASPDPVLKDWLARAAAAEAGKRGEADLIAASLAVSPIHLQPLMQAKPQAEALLGQILQLTADREPTVLVVQQKPDRYEATVRGPELAPPPATHGPGKPARHGRSG